MHHFVLFISHIFLTCCRHCKTEIRQTHWFNASLLYMVAVYRLKIPKYLQKPWFWRIIQHSKSGLMRFNKVQEALRRFKKVRKGLMGSKWFDIFYINALECSRRFKKVQEGTSRFKNVQVCRCLFLKAKSWAVACFSKPNLEPLPISQSQIWSHCLFLKYT